MNKSLILKIYALLSFSSIFAGPEAHNYGPIAKRYAKDREKLRGSWERDLGYSFFVMGLERGSKIPKDIMRQIAAYAEPSSTIFNPDVLVVPSTAQDAEILEKLKSFGLTEDKVKTLVLYLCFENPSFKEELLACNYRNDFLSILNPFISNHIAKYGVKALFGTSNPGRLQTLWFAARNISNGLTLPRLRGEVRTIADKEWSGLGGQPDVMFRDFMMNFHQEAMLPFYLIEQPLDYLSSTFYYWVTIFTIIHTLSYVSGESLIFFGREIISPSRDFSPLLILLPISSSGILLAMLMLKRSCEILFNTI